MQSRWLLILALACAAGLWMTAPARAVIMVLVPLSDVVDKEEFIFIAKVKEILADKPAMVLVPDENLKGKAPFERMPVGLAGDGEAKKGKHTDVLLDRIDKDSSIIIIATKRGGKYIAFGFTNGTWFSMDGRIEKQEGKEVVRWSFLHCEPYLRRTFKGTTAELTQIIVDAVAKKKAPPAPDEKEPPGFGPPIKKNSGIGSVFPPLAVIQLPFLGLIAALAALFPTVFGGLALFMKRWVAVLSTSGIVSLFVAVPVLAGGWAAKQWYFSPSGTWLTCAILFSCGALWSLRRYRRSLETDTSDVMQPRKADRLFVTLLFTGGLTALLIGFAIGLPIWTSDYWRWTLAGTIALGAGSWCLLTSYLYSRERNIPLRITPETVMLWALTGTCVAYGAWESGRFAQRDALVQGSGGVGQPTLNPDTVWRFAPPGGGMVVNSCATPERLYVAVMVVEGLTGRFGRIYALDPNTGAEIWHFDNDYEKDSEQGMKPAFSAPVFADGRLYFGEGLHTDNDSRLFCLDAATGTKLWQYATESHTESTPFVADGKVVVGAGYQGLHCVDAVDGKPLWIYPKGAKAADKLAHVDCNPVISNGRVYAASGYKPDYVKQDGKTNTIFCLDLNTGEKVWDDRVEDSVYGSPLVQDGRVYYGTGNSTYSESIPSKRPGILCRDAVSGKEIWDRILPENVMGRPVADKFQLFIGCLDGKAYALDLRTGQINWSLDMGSPVLAGPLIEIDKKTGAADIIYFAGKRGTISAVSPYAGKVFWSAPLSFWAEQSVADLSGAPTLLRTEDENEVRRRLFVGFGQGKNSSTVPRLFCIEDVSKKK